MSSDSTRCPEGRRGRAVGDEKREPSDDGRLADARLADQHRVVLLPARQDLHDPLDLLGPADRRIELALGRELRQVAAEVVERGSWTSSRTWAPSSAGSRRSRRRGLRHVAPEEPQRLRAALLEVHAGVGEHLGAMPFSSRRRPSSRCSVPTYE